MKYLIELPGPIVLAAPHFGSFISGALILMKEVMPKRRIHFMYADPKTDPGNARYLDFYTRYFPDASILFNNKAGIIKAARALKTNDIVVVMPDVFSGPDLIEIPLLGRTIGVMGRIPYFKRKFSAHVIPALSTFSSFWKVNIYIDKEIKFPEIDQNNQQAVKTDLRILFSYFEKWFIKHPEDWHCWERFGLLSS